MSQYEMTYLYLCIRLCENTKILKYENTGKNTSIQAHQPQRVL